MAWKFAINHPVDFSNHIENIAIVGAGGTIGSYITKALIAQGKHKLTAITRPDSQTTLPTGLDRIEKLDYDDHAGLAEAMKGQDAIVITLPATAAPGTQNKLIDAAVEAGVRYIMPNEYGQDLSNESLCKETIIVPHALAIREYIEKVGKGKTHWIALTSGFWYEHSLAGSEYRYGFNFDKKILVLFDDGNTKICTITWRQSGEAIAKLFGLKIFPEDANDKSLTLNQFEDKAAFVNSFTVSQCDMFQSVLRVTGDKESDWTITHDNSQERYQSAVKLMQSGNMLGLVVAVYTRMFYRNGGGDFSNKVVNEQLGLVKEDLDEATKISLQLRGDGALRAVYGGTST
ncbi:NAD(P)-binding protein [Acephala macrosclerotiorum]|nr:NAD(P)-binding protein [Acephala macrosclerotiorum]